MQIRNFTEADADEVVALWAECGLTVPWNDPRKDVSRKLVDGGELFLVGVEQGLIVASVMGGYDGHRGCMNYLAVSPRFQGNGFGQSLVREIEARLVALGCPKINILVRTSNASVIEFYEGMGYEPDAVVCLGKRLIDDK